MVYYAFSCAEQVENIHEPAMYTKAVVSGDREKWILDMGITRDRNSGLLFLSQQSYIKKVHRFNMHDAKSVSTPIAPHFKLSALR